MPLAFWMVETQLPRIGVNPPTITVSARTPEAVPHAEAKRLRLQHYLNECGWVRPMIRTYRQLLVLGDGPVKVPWSAERRMPYIAAVPWWDFFLSAEAQDWPTAEWIFQRTFWTRRGLADLAAQTDARGRGLWAGLEEVRARSGSRSHSDETYDRRRSLAHMGPDSRDDERACLIEAWHRDGSYVVVGGNEGETLVRAQVSPFHDRRGMPLRPFVLFQSLLDITGPYSISLPEVLEDHQAEVSTIRNQWIDQVTANINAPVIHADSIPAADVEAALAQPNGRLAVPADQFVDIRQAVMRMPPGQVTGDFPLLYEQIRSEAQMAGGVSDISAGQVSAEGLSNQTATGMSIIAGETNKRVQLLLRMIELAMGGGQTSVAGLFDALDRQFGAQMAIPVPPLYDAHGAEGVSPLSPDPMAPLPEGAGAFPGGFASVGTSPNIRAADYAFEVDAGSTQRPDQREEAQKVLAFIQSASHPAIAPLVNWREVAAQLVKSHGLSEQRMLSAHPGAQEAPVGPPVPLEPPGAAGASQANRSLEAVPS